MSAWPLLGTLLAVASAAPPGRILVLDDADAAGAVSRLRAELEGLGFVAVVERAPSAEPSSAALEEASLAANAIAGVRVRASRDGVEVWVLDRATHKLALREAVLQGEDSADQELVALRAVELLRASLLDVEQPAATPTQSAVPASPTPAPPLPAASPALEEPHRARWAASVAVAGSMSAGGVQPVVQLRLAAEVRLLSRVRLGLEAVLPTRPATLRDATGSATLTTSALLVAPSLDLLSAGAPVSLRVGLDGGIGWVRASGSGAPGYSGARSDLLMGLIGAHAAALREIGWGFYAFGELGALLGLPQLKLQFAGRQEASYGLPIGIALLGVGYQR